MLASVSAVLRSARAGLVVGLGLAFGASAQAATVYVDGAGVCAGLTPCFTTIQQGVDNSDPPPGVVFVFPGDYAESVDLSGSSGDLALRTVNGAGVPTPGTASILPAAGAALRVSAPPFPGALTVAGFIVQSPDTNGITLGTVQGDLTLSDVVSDDNGTNGLVGSVMGDVTITNSSFSDNGNGFGLSLAGLTNLVFIQVAADGNNGFNASVSLSGTAYIAQSSFSESVTGFGLSFAGATDVTLDQVTADGNNGFNTSFSHMGVARLIDSSFSNSLTGFGLSFAGATDVRLERVMANANNGFNTSFSNMGAATIVDSFFRNSVTSFGLSFAGASDVTLIAVGAFNNNGFNTSFSASGAVLIRDSTFDDSVTTFGLSVASPATARLERVISERNRSFNASLSVVGTLEIIGSSFSGSETSFGLGFVSPLTAILQSVVADGNFQNGVLANSTNLSVTGSRFTNNRLDGIKISTAEAGGSQRLRCNDIAGNQQNGLVMQSDAAVEAEQNYWGSPTGPQHPSNPAGTGNPVVDGANGGSGTVDFVPFLTEPSADSAVCKPHGAPALGGIELALLALALLVLPAVRLSRRRAA